MPRRSKQMIGCSRKRSVIASSILALFFLGAAAVPAQYRFDHWTTDSGLPQNSVYDMVQTRDGYLWLATVDGLARFDGVRFQVFSRSNSTGIVNNRFISLFEDLNGDLWAGTEERGLTRLHAGRFTSYGDAEGVKSGVSYRIVGDESGNATVRRGETELIRFANDKFSSIENVGFPHPASNRQKETSSRLLCQNAAVGAEFQRCFIDGKWTAYSVADSASPPDELKHVQGPDGKIWFITSNDQHLYRVENERAVPVDPLSLPGKSIGFVTGVGLHLISKDARGDLWLTDLNSMKSEPLLRETAQESVIVTDAAHCAVRDGEGNLWFGTVRDGLLRARRQAVTTFSKAAGLEQANVYPVYQDRAGEIWVGTINGLFTFRDDVFKPTEAPKTWIHAIGEDADGRLLFSVWDSLYVRENGRIGRFNPTEISAVGTINAIHSDRQKRLWIGGTEGLMRFDGGVLTRFTASEGLAGDDVKVIIERRSGGLWIGTYGGLTLIENNQLTSWTEADGLPSRTIRSLYEDADGTLWIGTYDGGVARFKEGKFTRYDVRIGLYNDGAFQILEDDNNHFWISSNRGIYRVSKVELNAFADGKLSRIASIAFGKSDGMLNAECNGGRSPAGIKTQGGELWFPTQEGIAVINPATIKLNSKPPPVLIESVKIDNIEEPILPECGTDGAGCGPRTDSAPGLQSQIVESRNETYPRSNRSPDITINPDQQNFEIRYTALSFINSENLRFKYRLEGLDADWIDAGTRRTAYFSHVAPGEYTFRVTAANSDGVWNTTGESLKIVILPPFYRTSWFAAITIFAFGAAAFALYRRRMSKFERARHLQEEFSRRLINANESERRRIAGELHDSIGQSLAMIKNRAVLTAECVTDENMRQQLELITTQTTQTIGEVRAISYALRPYLLDKLGLTKALRSLLNKIAETSGLTMEAELDDVDGIFSDEAEMSIYRIIQESLGNVMKHAEASTVQIFVKQSGRNLTVLISDDGKGFDLNALRARDAGDGGFGLLGIAERVKMLGGTQEIDSAAEGGTTILIKIPVRPLETRVD